MFFVLSKLLDIFLSPFTWCLLGVAFAIPWRARDVARWRRRRLVAGALALFVLVTLSTNAVANTLTARLERSVESTYRPDVVYDAVILLGGVVDEEIASRTGQPAYNDNVERLVMTHKLLADGKAKLAIVSGAAMDARFVEFGEARALVRQLEAWGIARDRLVIEDRARNTRENAVYTEEIVRAGGYSRVLIVTSAFHMPRAVECYRAVGMTVDTLAVDFRSHMEPFGLGDFLPRAGHLAVSASMIREITGRYVYRFQGYAKSGG